MGSSQWLSDHSFRQANHWSKVQDTAPCLKRKRRKTHVRASRHTLREEGYVADTSGTHIIKEGS